LSNDISGIVFPKNTLSKNGIIMTNPGHVDPGYNGILTLYLVNMSKETYKLRAQDAVARLLLFKTSSITSGYQGSSVTQVDEEQLSSMGKDFAGLNTRMTSALRKVLAEWSVVLFVIIGIMISIIGFAVPIAFTMTTSHFDNTQELKQSIKNQEEKIENLNKQITLLNSLEPKHSDIIQKRTAK
jgi:cell division protein FtsL